MTNLERAHEWLATSVEDAGGGLLSERLAELLDQVAAEEREACAQIRAGVVTEEHEGSGHLADPVVLQTCRTIAWCIRARGAKP